MVGTVTEEMMGPVAFAEYHYRTEFSVAPVCEQVNARLGVTILCSGTVQKSVEHLGCGFCCLSLDDEDSGGELSIVVESGILDLCQIGHVRLIHIIFKRHQPFWNTLEMMVIRSRCATARPIIEECQRCILPCEVEHIDISVPYGLVCMPVHSYDQMIRENRVWINEDMVFLSLAAFELHHYLLLRPVLPTQETAAGGDILLGKFGSRRHHAGGVELQLDLKPSDLQLAYTYILEGPEVVASQWPAGKLVTDEFMYSCFFHKVERFSRLCAG